MTKSDHYHTYLGGLTECLYGFRVVAARLWSVNGYHKVIAIVWNYTLPAILFDFLSKVNCYVLTFYIIIICMHS